MKLKASDVQFIEHLMERRQQTVAVVWAFGKRIMVTPGEAARLANIAAATGVQVSQLLNPRPKHEHPQHKH